MHGCVLLAIISNTVRYPSSPPPSGTAGEAAVGIVAVDAKLSSTVITYGCVSIETRRFDFCSRKIPFRTRNPHLCDFLKCMPCGKFITFSTDRIQTNVVETLVRGHLVYTDCRSAAELRREVKGFKSAATSRSLGNRTWQHGELWDMRHAL